MFNFFFLHSFVLFFKSGSVVEQRRNFNFIVMLRHLKFVFFVSCWYHFSNRLSNDISEKMHSDQLTRLRMFLWTLSSSSRKVHVVRCHHYTENAFFEARLIRSPQNEWLVQFKPELVKPGTDFFPLSLFQLLSHLCKECETYTTIILPIWSWKSLWLAGNQKSLGF